MSKLASLQLKKSRIVNYSRPDTYDPDLDSDSEEDEEITRDDADDEDLFDDDEENLSDNLVNVSTSTFQEMRVFDSINSTLANSYFIVNVNGVKKYLHKQTATWLLSKNKPILPSDRLKRVMTKNK